MSNLPATSAHADSSSLSPMMPHLNADRLWERLQKMATFTRPDTPWTRRAFSKEFIHARQWLAGEFEAAGLSVRLDAAGNLSGHLTGSDPSARPFITGSHTDTVTHGGRFDGVLGVLAGLEVLESFRESGCKLRHPLEVIDFIAEEPSDHGVSCVGSRAFAGNLPGDLLLHVDAAGESLGDAMRRIGGAPDRLVDAARTRGGMAAFVELHIEQGPVLEHERIPVGVVTHIVGIRRVYITVQGRPDHAGTTPMGIRQDALAGAAHIVSMVRAIADQYQSGTAYVVATIGRIDVSPNAANSVPGQVDMTLEVRSDSPQVLQDFPDQVMGACDPELQRLRVQAAVNSLTWTSPTACAPMVMQAIERAASNLHLPSKRLPSGAGHDALHLAAVGPVGMIFVPCLDGRSHCPEEWIDKEAAVNGARVLAGSLAELDRLLD